MSFGTYHQPDTLKNSQKILRSTSNSSNLSQLSSNSRPRKKIKSFVKSDDRDKIVNQKIKYRHLDHQDNKKDYIFSIN